MHAGALGSWPWLVGWFSGWLRSPLLFVTLFVDGGLLLGAPTSRLGNDDRPLGTGRPLGALGGLVGGGACPPASTAFRPASASCASRLTTSQPALPRSCGSVRAS